MRKRWTRWIARLYPASWRERYLTEFEALIEDLDARWIDLVDALKGAIVMQSARRSLWQFVAACGLAGVAVAGVVAWRAPRRYMSTAVVHNASNGAQSHRATAFAPYAQVTLSKRSLVGLIQTYDLYHDERVRVPIDEVVDRMRNDIRIAARGSNAFAISFAGSGQAVAQRVVSDITQATIAELNVHGEPRILEVNNLPARIDQSPYIPIIALGFAVGMFCGLVLIGVRTWPLVASVGGVMALVGLAGSYGLRDRYESTSVIRTDATATPEVIKNLLLADTPGRERLSIREIVNLSSGKLPAVYLVQSSVDGASWNWLGDDSARYAACSAMENLVAQLYRRLGPAGIEVIDPPSTPQTPVYPRRWVGAAIPRVRSFRFAKRYSLTASA